MTTATSTATQLNLCAHFSHATKRHQTQPHATSPSTPWGACLSDTCFPSQGGGVYKQGSTTPLHLQNCNIYQNNAISEVRNHLHHMTYHIKPYHRPKPRWGACFYNFVISVQGGGVHIYVGTVAFVNCDIHSNTAAYVRSFLARHQTRPHATFPSAPMGCAPMGCLLLQSRHVCAGRRHQHVLGLR